MSTSVPGPHGTGQYANTGVPYMAPPGSRPSGGLLDLKFTRFLSLSLISIWWVVSLIAIGLAAVVGVIIGVVWAAGDRGALLGILLILGSLVGAVIAAVLVRLSLESVAVLFRIANNTSAMVERLR